MSCCDELGLDENTGWRVARSVDAQAVVTATPATIDFAGFVGEIVIKEALDDASPLLTIGTTATAAGSVMVFSENTILALIRKADIQTLPENADDAAEPWIGWFEWTVTSPGASGTTDRIYQLPFIVGRGAAE